MTWGDLEKHRWKDLETPTHASDQHKLGRLANAQPVRTFVTDDLLDRIREFEKTDPYENARYPKDDRVPSLAYSEGDAKQALELASDMIAWARQSALHPDRS